MFVSTEYTAPRKLTKQDVIVGFRSGAGELDDWLVRFAWQNQQANNAVTYVITDGTRVIGYYALAMAAVGRISAPASIAARRPDQIPCVLLARLAVDRAHQGKRLGWELLRDGLIRAVHLSQSIGAAAVLVHCRDEAARAFYLRHADFLQSPVDEWQLMLPVRGLRKYVGVVER